MITAEVLKAEGIKTVFISTIYRVLRSEGYSVYKRTMKPGLIKENIERRLKQYQERVQMTLEDWKYVIFLDKTSIVISRVRSKRRVQRLILETYYLYVIHRRWKGKKEFMQQSCFTWFEKGLYYIQEEEIPEEKKAAKIDLAVRNKAQ